MSRGSDVSVWIPNAMLYNALLTGRKTHKTAPLPWDFVTPQEGGLSHGHRQDSQKF